MVAKKSKPWSKTSIDFIGIMNVDDKEFNETMVPLGVEVKCRVNSSEVAKEQEHIRRLKRRKYESISSDEVFNNLSKVDERFQLLHHVYVYDFLGCYF